jgi:cell division protein FtsI/penicillin-binding protein 2
MLDTRGVRASTILALALGLSAATGFSSSPRPASWPAAVASVTRANPQAGIVILDIASGHLLASSNLQQAARTLAAPGSTLKPIALYQLIAAGRWNPARRIACTRTLSVAGRSLNCSHLPADPMDARQALAWSCNTYFAAVAAALKPGELRSVLAPSGLLSQTGLSNPGPGKLGLSKSGPSPSEATADFRDPRTPDDNRLALLGVDGIRITPLELAAAYRWLALALAGHSGSAAAQVVQAGLADSAGFGIAAPASSSGVAVAGKTGTANLGAGTPSHGWFAGLVPAAHPTAVIVVYLPAGHGANAASVAASVLAGSPLARSAP